MSNVALNLQHFNQDAEQHKPAAEQTHVESALLAALVPFEDLFKVVVLFIQRHFVFLSTDSGSSQHGGLLVDTAFDVLSGVLNIVQCLDNSASYIF